MQPLRRGIYVIVLASMCHMLYAADISILSLPPTEVPLIETPEIGRVNRSIVVGYTPPCITMSSGSFGAPLQMRSAQRLHSSVGFAAGSASVGQIRKNSGMVSRLSTGGTVATAFPMLNNVRWRKQDTYVLAEEYLEGVTGRVTRKNAGTNPDPNKGELPELGNLLPLGDGTMVLLCLLLGYVYLQRRRKMLA